MTISIYQSYLDEMQVEEIKIAMEAFENKTCIRFKERKHEILYINITKKTKRRYNYTKHICFAFPPKCCFGSSEPGVLVLSVAKEDQHKFLSLQTSALFLLEQ